MSALSPALAHAHEALYPRLETLARQVEAIAARKPEADVPPETLSAAESLLFDAQRFRPRRRTAAATPGGPAGPLPAAPGTYGALATVLGQALAGLTVFEARHSVWSEPHKGFVWQVTHARLLPVQRLRPHAPAPPDLGVDKNAARLRAELIRRIEAKYDEGFDAGLRAAQNQG